MQKNNPSWAFFGTTRFSVIALEELKAQGFVPKLIITTEDKPKGRNLVLTPPEVKVWAEKESIPYIQPSRLKDLEVVEKIKGYALDGFDVFVLFSYGKLIPQEILSLPKHGILNIHPSLLPKLRGPSPIKSAILAENETGVTIIKLDEEMDHGPILAQEKVVIPEWPPYESDLEETLAHVGGKLVARIMQDWIDGKINETPQDHTEATLCQKVTKTDGELNMADSADLNLRKIRAFHVWPGAYLFDKGKRIIIKRAHIENDKLMIDRVTPEGKKEMDYKGYLNGKKSV